MFHDETCELMDLGLLSGHIKLGLITALVPPSSVHPVDTMDEHNHAFPPIAPEMLL